MDFTLSSCTVSVLPLDVLAHVFAFTSKRTRLGVISFVCRRWRSAALRATTELIQYSSERLPELLPLHSRLTSLMVIDGPGPVDIVFPPTLTSLDIANFATETAGNSLEPFLRLSGLRNLRIGWSLLTDAALIKFCANSATSLTTLSMNVPDSILPASLHLHLPALTQLDMSKLSSRVSPFVSRHAKQLTSFSFTLTDAPTERNYYALFGDSTFPSLQHLGLSGDALSLLPDLLARCPASACIQLNATLAQCDEHASLLTRRLSHFTLDAEQPGAHGEMLHQCARLTTVHSCTASLYSLLAQSPIRSQLTDLDCSSSADLLTTLTTFPNLVSLALPMLEVRTPPPTLPALTALTELQVESHGQCRAVIPVLQTAMQASPRLTNLIVEWRAPAAAEDRAVIAAFLREADARGVERIYVSPPGLHGVAVPPTTVMSVLPL